MWRPHVNSNMHDSLNKAINISIGGFSILFLETELFYFTINGTACTILCVLFCFELRVTVTTVHENTGCQITDANDNEKEDWQQMSSQKLTSFQTRSSLERNAGQKLR